MVQNKPLHSKCNECKEYLDLYCNNYKCNECSSFYLCEICRFSEAVSHSHSLHRLPAKLRDYPYFIKESKKKNGNKLILGSYSSAISNSQCVKQQNIKIVLTLLHFDISEPSKGNTELDKLQNIFFTNGKYSSIISHDKIIYFHINVPDIEDPKQLSYYNCEDLLPKSIMFIEYGLRLGNVLVHCEKGQRRSPTVFLSWLIYNGYSLIESIDMIALDYDGDEDWGESYKRRRNLWIDGPLHEWQDIKKRKNICKKWISSNKELVKKWNSIIFPPKPQVSNLKKRKRNELENETEAENIPLNKKQKINL